MATPTNYTHPQPAIPWPYPDDRPQSDPPRWYRRPEKLAIVAVSVVAIGALVVVLALAFNVSRSTTGRAVSAFPSELTASPPTSSLPSWAPNEPSQDRSRLDRSTYASIGARDFALMAKDPDAWNGRRLIVYGVVTQFDTNTGPAAFRADTAATPNKNRYEYQQNTYIEARDPQIVADIVEDDWVTMYVEVAGSYAYPTQIGGATTAPMMFVNIIEPISRSAEPPIPAPVPSPTYVDPEAASYAQLRAIADSDRPFVSAQLADHWVPQLSSKRPGIVDKGIVWDNVATLNEHLLLRETFPGVRLLWSGDWSTFDASNFWVTVAGVTFATADGALAWCTNQALGPNDCYAKLVSATHPVAGSTAHN
jgi:hypothetical protein